MKIKSLSFRDYCGFRKLALNFRDFTCLVGPNGIGKTTILNAVSLMLCSLDFDAADATPGGFGGVKPEVRIQQYLRKNIRNIDDPGAANSFRAEALFEHEGVEYPIVLTEKGFEQNNLIKQDFWWAGLCYFARFDSDMVNFQLRYELWPKFKKAYEGITGISIDPDVYTETDLRKIGQNGDIVTGFFMNKDGDRVKSSRASAGEKKIAKTLSQIVNLEEARQPSIVLIDNLEMHVHYKRHLRMADEIKDLFKGKQIIGTTHSPVLINEYSPKEDMFDIEVLREQAKI